MLSSLQEMSIGARYRDDLAMPWERGMVGAALGHTMPLSVPKMMWEMGTVVPAPSVVQQAAMAPETRVVCG